MRVQSVAHPEVMVEQYIDLTVPGDRARRWCFGVEPSVVRVKDGQAGPFPGDDRQLGRQPEPPGDAGRPGPRGRSSGSSSRPAVLDVPAGGTAGAAVRVEAPAPGTRRAGHPATDGVGRRRRGLVESSGDLRPVRRRSRCRWRCGSNRAWSGSGQRRPARSTSPSTTGAAPGPDGFSWAVGIRNGWCISPSPRRRSTCCAGELGRARLRIEAPPPPPGQESTQHPDRAGHVGGHRRPRGQPRRSCRPPRPRRSTPRSTVRLDPSVVRVRDTAVGQLDAIIDNRGGTRVRRVFLSGRDPERLVRFTFSPPSLDVLPGEIGRVRVRLEAPLPDPGQDATHQITVDRRRRRHGRWRRPGPSSRSPRRRRSRHRSR